jgi:hypothetical protein
MVTIAHLAECAVDHSAARCWAIGCYTPLFQMRRERIGQRDAFVRGSLSCR